MDTRDDTSDEYGDKLPDAKPQPSEGSALMREQIARQLFGPAPTPERALERIGKYERIKRAGRGGMGDVWLAHDPDLDRPVAIKLVPLSKLSPARQDQLWAEAQVLARLDHPHIVTVHGVNREAERVYMVMEYVEHTLDTVRESLEGARLLELCRQAGSGLAAAHAEDIVHRDIKPSNVLVDGRDRARIADFGLARVMDEYSATTAEAGASTRASSRGWAGTPGYIAPELFIEGRGPDLLSDQFAYCVMLWEVLGGQRPFTHEQLEDAHRHGTLPPVEGTFAGEPWIREVLARGLAYEPGERWPSVGDLVEALTPVPPKRRLGTILGLGLGLGLALAALGSWLWPGQARPELCTSSLAPAAQLSALAERSTLGYAGPATDTLVAEFGAFERAWTEARDQRCAEHEGLGRQRSPTLEAQLACLAQARRSYETMVEAVFVDPDRALLRADELMVDLPRPSECEFIGLEPGARSGLVTTIEARLHAAELSELEALVALRAYLEVKTGAEALLSRVSSTGKTQAHAWVLAGIAQRQVGSPLEARELLHRGAREALRAGEPELELRAVAGLVELELDDFEAIERASLHLRDLELIVRRMPVSSAWAEAKLETMAAALASARGQAKEAEARLARARSLLQQSGAPAQAIDAVQLRLANSLVTHDRSAALLLYDELLVERRTRLGSGHPALGVVSFNIGVTLAEQGEWARAEPILAQAVSIFERALGPESVRLANAQTKYAEVLIELGELERGLELARRAWALQRRLLTPASSERGTALMVLGYAQSLAGAYDEALVSHEEMLEELELDDYNRAINRQTQAWLLARLGRWDAARAQAELSLIHADERLSRRARLVLAEVEFQTGAIEDARTRLHALREATPLEPPDSSLDVELMWLSALVEFELDAAQAESFARQAWAGREGLVADQKKQLVERFPALHE